MKYIFTAITVIVVGVMSASASADNFLSDIDFEAGYYNLAYDNEHTSGQGYQFRLGYDGFPLYLFAGQDDEVDVREGGQSVADTKNRFAGLGAKYEWRKLTFFAEVGYGETDEKVWPAATDEMAFTQLSQAGKLPTPEQENGLHVPEWQSREIFPGGWDGTYEIDDSWTGRVGVEYQVFKYMKVSASYRHFEVDETYSVTDRATGERYEDTFTADFNAWLMGVYLTF